MLTVPGACLSGGASLASSKRSFTLKSTATGVKVGSTLTLGGVGEAADEVGLAAKTDTVDSAGVGRIDGLPADGARCASGSQVTPRPTAARAMAASTASNSRNMPLSNTTFIKAQPVNP